MYLHDVSNFYMLNIDSIQALCYTLYNKKSEGMNAMKKFIGLLICTAILLSCISCGSTENDNNHLSISNVSSEEGSYLDNSSTDETSDLSNTQSDVISEISSETSSKEDSSDDTSIGEESVVPPASSGEYSTDDSKQPTVESQPESSKEEPSDSSAAEEFTIVGKWYTRQAPQDGIGWTPNQLYHPDFGQFSNDLIKYDTEKLYESIFISNDFWEKYFFHPIVMGVRINQIYTFNEDGTYIISYDTEKLSKSLSDLLNDVSTTVEEMTMSTDKQVSKEAFYNYMVNNGFTNRTYPEYKGTYSCDDNYIYLDESWRIDIKTMSIETNNYIIFFY